MRTYGISNQKNVQNGMGLYAAAIGLRIAHRIHIFDMYVAQCETISGCPICSYTDANKDCSLYISPPPLPLVPVLL